MSKAKFEPGEGLRWTESVKPLTRFLTEPHRARIRATRWFETTLSHRGRGYAVLAAALRRTNPFHFTPSDPR